jgi:hypothetical protein
MRHISSERLDRSARFSTRLPMNRPRRLRQDEPPIEHPARLRYLLTLLQQELSAAE